MIDIYEPARSRSECWYAVQARPNQERRAAMNLGSFGVTTFLPMVRAPRRPGTGVTVPLFPRYLFVRCDIGTSVQKIRYTRGVAQVLGTTAGPTVIDDEIIQSIQSRIGEDGLVALTETAMEMEVGTPVEVMSGPLKGFTGIFHSATTAAQRVVLLLKAMNSQVRVLVDTSAIRRLNA